MKPRRLTFRDPLASDGESVHPSLVEAFDRTRDRKALIGSSADGYRIESDAVQMLGDRRRAWPRSRPKCQAPSQLAWQTSFSSGDRGRPPRRRLGPRKPSEVAGGSPFAYSHATSFQSSWRQKERQEGARQNLDGRTRNPMPMNAFDTFNSSLPSRTTRFRQISSCLAKDPRNVLARLRLSRQALEACTHTNPIGARSPPSRARTAIQGLAVRQTAIAMSSNSCQMGSESNGAVFSMDRPVSIEIIRSPWAVIERQDRAAALSPYTRFDGAVKSCWPMACLYRSLRFGEEYLPVSALLVDKT